MTANEDAWELFQTAAGVLYDSMGGVQLQNLRQIADGLGLEWSVDLIKKLVALIKAVKDDENQGPGDD